MKTNITFGGIIGTVLVAILLFLFFFYRNDLKKVFTEKLNPTSDKNIAYEAANVITREISGDPDATLGTKLFEVVDDIKGWIPFLESTKERDERLREEFLEKRKPMSQSATQVEPKNGGDISIRFPNIPGDKFQRPVFIYQPFPTHSGSPQ